MDKRERFRMTQGIVKEALFNILGQSLSKRSLLDLYAGEGGVGIEALIRGADRVAFVEIASSRARAIRERLKRIKREAIVYQGNVLSILKRIELDFDIIFLDPPYNKGLVIPTLDLIANKVRFIPLVVIEHHHKERLPSIIGPLKLSNKRCYGETSLSLYRKGLD